MDSIHIFYNKLEIDKDVFTSNISLEKNVENVIFDKNKEYTVTGITIKPEITDSELVKVKNIKELDRISKEIQEITKNYKEPDLTLSISNPEIKAVLVPFVKKSESELPRIKLTFFNTITNKNEDFFVYDYYKHLKRSGFVWEYRVWNMGSDLKMRKSL